MNCLQKLSKYYETLNEDILEEMFLNCYSNFFIIAYKQLDNVEEAKIIVDNTYDIWKRNIVSGNAPKLDSCCKYARKILLAQLELV